MGNDVSTHGEIDKYCHLARPFESAPDQRGCHEVRVHGEFLDKYSADERILEILWRQTTGGSRVGTGQTLYR